MKFRLHDCKNQKLAIPIKRKEELFQCIRKEPCGKKIHTNHSVFCRQSPIFEERTHAERSKL